MCKNIREKNINVINKYLKTTNIEINMSMKGRKYINFPKLIYNIYEILVKAHNMKLAKLILNFIWKDKRRIMAKSILST